MIRGLFLLGCSLGGLLSAATADDLAQRILAAVDRPVAFAHLPRCADATLAVALAAQAPRLAIHGQVAQADRLQAARRQADDRGLAGRRIWFDAGTTGLLLPVGRSADLVAMTDLAATDLTPQLAAELRRVLHPWYGAAVLGDVTGSIDTGALRAWAGGIGPATPLPGSGTFVVVRAPPLPGSDDWSHWWHGPDNNAVSTDTAFTLPATMQWLGKPYFSSTRLEQPILSGGRLFMLWNGHAMDKSVGVMQVADAIPGDGPLLTAHAVGNGNLLWMQRLAEPAWRQVARSILIADGDHLLVAEGGSITERDAVTGRELRRIDTGLPEIKWMAHHAGGLYVLGGPATRNLGQRSEEAVTPFRSSGTILTAYDRSNLAQRWRNERHAGSDAFDPRSPAIAGDRLFITGEDDSAVAIALADGRQIWRVQVGFQRSRQVDFSWDRSSRHPVTGYAVLGVYVIAGLEMPEAVAIAQADGARLWTTRNSGTGAFMPLAHDGLLWRGTDLLDPLTGTVVRSVVKTGFGGCARDTLAPVGVLDGCGLSYVPQAQAPGRLLEALKSSCNVGTLVAQGLQWKFPLPCTNCTEWRGFVVQGPREQPPQPGPRHHGKAAPPQGPALTGWTTYRGDNARSSSVAAPTPVQAAIRWTTPAPAHSGTISLGGLPLLDAELVPTPPVIARDLVITGHADGAVDAYDLATGAPRWRTLTGGRIHSSPTLWHDRVLVGSADGHVYALSVKDGSELWRLRVAPDHGRLMQYGQLGSRWPVTGSPLVAEGRVYASAGLVDMIDGVHAVCADVTDGHVLWERSTWDQAEASGGVSGGAQFALGDTLFYHGGAMPPIRLDPRDGATQPAFPTTAAALLGRADRSMWKTSKAFASTWNRVKGQDVGILGPRWITWGGRRMHTDQSEDATWRSHIMILARDAQGQGRLPAISVPDVDRLPSWDAQDAAFFVSAKRARALVLIAQLRLQATLDQLMAGTDTAAILARAQQPAKQAVTVPPEDLSRELIVTSTDLSRWSITLGFRDELMTCVLTANAVLLATARTDPDPTRDQPGSVTAYARSDGKPLWSIPLPARAIHDGLAVAADGQIIVTLVDGRVLAIDAP